MAKLYFRYGAMGSSKTANAIMVQYNYEERGQKVLMLKPKLENRDGAVIVRSRCGLETACRFIEDVTAADAQGYGCVIIDEAQFLTKAQVEMLVEMVDDYDVPVIAYGLRADFQNNFFEGSQWLMAWADTIEEIKTICWLDRHGWVPKSMVESDPYYSSVVLSNLGSIGLKCGYHHLTNWGTCSLFCIIGEKKKSPFINEDGTVTMRETLELGLTIDERLADGYYYSKSVRLLEYLLTHPEELEKPMSEEVQYE